MPAVGALSLPVLVLVLLPTQPHTHAPKWRGGAAGHIVPAVRGEHMLFKRKLINF